MAQSIIDRKPEDMSKDVGHTITLGVIAVPALLLALLGLVVGNGYTALGLAVGWIIFFFAASTRIYRRATFAVVERFGKFWDVKFAGFRLVIPLIDVVVYRDDMLQKTVKLFQRGDTPIEIDFIGGSAPIDASGWYQIGNPIDIENGDLDAVEEQILRHTYRLQADARAPRVAELYEGAFRHYLEERDIPTAQKEMPQIVKDATLEARFGLEAIGVYPFQEQGIIARDIDLPDALQQLRLQETRGEAEAKERINRSRAYWEPLTQMKEGFAIAGMALRDEQVMEIFLTQRTLETIQQTDANVSFVQPDMQGVIKTLSVGSTGSPRNRPQQGAPS